MSPVIGGIELSGDLVMAPLAGYTDVAFRRLVTENGAAMAVTEMVSARALSFGSLKTEALLATAPSEKIKCVQLFGREPENFTAALRLKALDKFDIVDINFGCPVKKIVRNGEGSAMMADILKASKIVRACVSAARRPVTVKIRLGIDEAHRNYLEFAQAMAAAGAAAVTLHGRTASQLYRGEADWTAVERLRRALSIPVLGSGDVVGQSSYERCRDAADGVMIGRGALADPGIFLRLKGGTPPPRSELVLRHLEYLKNYFDERYAVIAARKFAVFYLKGVRDGKEVKGRIMGATGYNELLTLLRSVLPRLDRSEGDV